MKSAFSSDWPIPAYVSLPGCRVRVVVREIDPKGPDGFWSYDTDKGKAQVSIRAGLPLSVQRYVLLHELLHTVHEIIDICLEEHPHNVSTKNMAERDGLMSQEEPCRCCRKEELVTPETTERV